MTASTRKAIKYSVGVLAVVGAVLLVAGGTAFYRIYYGRHIYETTPPALPESLGEGGILIFSKTNGFREPTAVGHANDVLTAICNEQGWPVFVTENGAVFNERDLRRFRATVWNNVSGDVLTAGQKAVFEKWIEGGGGYVGIHGAGGDPHYEWRWYVEKLLGAEFKGHPLGPQFQRATVHVERAEDGAMQGVPAEWVRVDEWYSFKQSPRGNGVTVLATVDERTYKPKMLFMNIGIGADHPVIWKHQVGQGRAFYSALGHSASAYDDPIYRGILTNAIRWAAGLPTRDVKRSN